jgi:hypothetical protein
MPAFLPQLFFINGGCPRRWLSASCRATSAGVQSALVKTNEAANLNSCSEFSSGSAGTFPWASKFNPHSTEEDNMKKLGYVIAALGAIAIAAPSIASAETLVVKHRDHDRFNARAEMPRDHGWRHHHDKVVIIKHRHHGY